MRWSFPCTIAPEYNMSNNKNCTFRYQESANFSSDNCGRQHNVFTKPLPGNCMMTGTGCGI